MQQRSVCSGSSVEGAIVWDCFVRFRGLVKPNAVEMVCAKRQHLLYGVVSTVIHKVVAWNTGGTRKLMSELLHFVPEFEKLCAICDDSLGISCVP